MQLFSAHSRLSWDQRERVRTETPGNEVTSYKECPAGRESDPVKTGWGKEVKKWRQERIRSRTIFFRPRLFPRSVFVRADLVIFSHGVSPPGPLEIRSFFQGHFGGETAGALRALLLGKVLRVSALPSDRFYSVLESLSLRKQNSQRALRFAAKLCGRKTTNQNADRNFYERGGHKTWRKTIYDKEKEVQNAPKKEKDWLWGQHDRDEKVEFPTKLGRRGNNYGKRERIISTGSDPVSFQHKIIGKDESQYNGQVIWYRAQGFRWQKPMPWWENDIMLRERERGSTQDDGKNGCREKGWRNVNEWVETEKRPF